MKPGVAARREAAEAIGRILRSGAFSNRLLELSTLPPRDVDQLRFLTYTTLRHLKRIDGVIERNSDKKVSTLDGEVADVLRIATAELLFGRAPTHAVVDTAVESIKMGRRRRAAGFVNGVLRSVVRSPETDLGSDEPREEYPDWLVGMLDEQWEREEVTGFLTDSLGDAGRQVRARAGVEVGELTGVCGISGAFDWTDRGELPDGFVVQDASSIAVGNAVPLRAGDLVLDMAAAPGGKAAHLLDRGARVVAADRNQRRATSGHRRWPEVAWTVADGAHPPFRSGSFDHVLLDAPCSGLGTMRRRPEVRYRTDARRIAELADRQRSMLARALSLVAPGGTVTYSVCTVTAAETVEVVAGLDAGPPPDTPGRTWGNGLLLGPHLTGTDGMFISIVQRR
jgi:16S rRNA (cytosine967-C5)-methyltransferase